MKKPFAVPTAALLGLLAFGTAACSSSGSTNASSTSTTTNTKVAFCAANKTIDKAGASVSSAAGFLAVLKANTAALDALNKNAPSGKVGNDTHQVVSAARSAIAANNPDLLNTPALNAVGPDLDTYCGVDGQGNPLPAYFGAGKATAICSVVTQLDAGTNNAPDAAAVLAFLKAHQSLITQFVADIPSLPGSLQSEAQALASTARSAIASNNPATIGTPAVQKESGDVDLYCGHNR